MKEAFSELPAKLKKILEQQLMANALLLNNIRILVFREDGVNFYDSSDQKNQIEAGALTSGLWQAATTLMKTFKSVKADSSFRLSYDTSNEGIFILPLKIYGQQYILEVIYFNEKNPAKIKQKMKIISKHIELQFIKQQRENSKHQKDFLFKNITDNEIDMMFKSIGNA